MAQSPVANSDELIRRLELQLAREKSGRQQAEALLEEKSLALYSSNQALRDTAALFGLIWPCQTPRLARKFPPLCWLRIPLKRNGKRAPLFEAEKGQVALAYLRQETFDLVLMDVQMPEMDGLDATRLLRQMPLPQQPVVIAMTANAFSEDGEACLAAGMDQFLNKPVTVALLRSALVKACRGQAAARLAVHTPNEPEQQQAHAPAMAWRGALAEAVPVIWHSTG